jgi:MFS family permease
MDPHLRARSLSKSSSNSPNEPDVLEHDEPWGLRWRSSTVFIISVVGVGIFTDLFVYAIIVPVLPFVLRDRIGVPDSQLQIYVSVLLATMAASSFVFSPFAGIIADRIGNRQQPFLGGLFALLFSTILLALGRSVGMIAFARILQGMSSAVVWVVGLAICLETVGPSRLGTTIGTVSNTKIIMYIGVADEIYRYSVVSTWVRKQHLCSEV